MSFVVVIVVVVIVVVIVVVPVVPVALVVEALVLRWEVAAVVLGVGTANTRGMVGW